MSSFLSNDIKTYSLIVQLNPEHDQIICMKYAEGNCTKTDTNLTYTVVYPEKSTDTISPETPDVYTIILTANKDDDDNYKPVGEPQFIKGFCFKTISSDIVNNAIESAILRRQPIQAITNDIAPVADGPQSLDDIVRTVVEAVVRDLDQQKDQMDGNNQPMTSPINNCPSQSIKESDINKTLCEKYKKNASILHPDKNKGCIEESTKKTQKLNEICRSPTDDDTIYELPGTSGVVSTTDNNRITLPDVKRIEKLETDKTIQNEKPLDDIVRKVVEAVVKDIDKHIVPVNVLDNIEGNEGNLTEPLLIDNRSEQTYGGPNITSITPPFPSKQYSDSKNLTTKTPTITAPSSSLKLKKSVKEIKSIDDLMKEFEPIATQYYNPKNDDELKPQILKALFIGIEIIVVKLITDNIPTYTYTLTEPTPDSVLYELNDKIQNYQNLTKFLEENKEYVKNLISQQIKEINERPNRFGEKYIQDSTTDNKQVPLFEKVLDENKLSTSTNDGISFEDIDIKFPKSSKVQYAFPVSSRSFKTNNNQLKKYNPNEFTGLVPENDNNKLNLVPLVNNKNTIPSNNTTDEDPITNVFYSPKLHDQQEDEDNTDINKEAPNVEVPITIDDTVEHKPEKSNTYTIEEALNVEVPTTIQDNDTDKQKIVNMYNQISDVLFNTISPPDRKQSGILSKKISEIEDLVELEKDKKTRLATGVKKIKQRTGGKTKKSKPNKSSTKNKKNHYSKKIYKKV